MTKLEKENRFLNLIKASTSPYHCVMEAAKTLKENGFKELKLDEMWKIHEGEKYFVNVYDSSLIAFISGDELSNVPTLRMAAAHTDWPCLKLKPNAELQDKKYGKLNIEVYGGPILNSWYDRPLGMAGKVCVKTDDPFKPETVFIDTKRAIASVPSLAIHMNRDVNKGVETNPQTDMLPLIKILDEKLNNDNFLLNLLADESGKNIEDILDYEIYLYNMDDPILLGLNNEFISAPRIDNISSVSACLSGILETPGKDNINMITLYDNEEVGSSTKQGALSSVTEKVIEKIFSALGYTRDELLNTMLKSFLISMDVAHAIHPNHPEKCDIKNKIYLGDGVAIKIAASQSYATDAYSVSIVEGICKAKNISYKKFSNRSDLRGGSTLGALSSTLMGIRTVDLGIPMLSMHSAREFAAINDQLALEELCRNYFSL